jgi:hypothetical protein
MLAAVQTFSLVSPFTELITDHLIGDSLQHIFVFRVMLALASILPNRKTSVFTAHNTSNGRKKPCLHYPER